MVDLNNLDEQTSPAALAELLAAPKLHVGDEWITGDRLMLPFRVALAQPWFTINDVETKAQDLALAVADEVDWSHESAKEEVAGLKAAGAPVSDELKAAASMKVLKAHTLGFEGAAASVALEIEMVDNPGPVLAIIAVAAAAAITAVAVWDIDFSITGIEPLEELVALLTGGDPTGEQKGENVLASLSAAAQIAAIAGLVFALR